MSLHKCGSEIAGFEGVNDISSAYKFILKSYSCILKPLICWLAQIAHARGSNAKIKIIGETGHLCLADLVSTKDEDTITFVLTGKWFVIKFL